MMNQKRLVILGCIIVIIILFLAFLGMQGKNNSSKLDLYQVSNNYRVDDEMVMYLYDKYQVEDGLKFALIGSDIFSQEEYGLYYKSKKMTFKQFPHLLKHIILLNDINYQEDGYDEERQCFLYSMEEYKNLYQKNYGSLEDFNLKDVDEIEEVEDKICIHELSGRGPYQFSLDTYFVNWFLQDDEIIIYERVAFIKITDTALEFYSDYKRKKHVYSLDKDKSDITFINNSKVVSNVLLKYQSKFPIYQYTYVKGKDTYYLESIERG